MQPSAKNLHEAVDKLKAFLSGARDLKIPGLTESLDDMLKLIDEGKELYDNAKTDVERQLVLNEFERIDRELVRHISNLELLEAFGNQIIHTGKSN